MSEIQAVFSKRLHDLRRTRGWSQPEVGKLIGTSGAIIGRYERGEMTPSIEVAKKLAEAFGVTLDSLVSQQEQSALVQDTSMIERIRAIGELSPEERDRLLYVVDGLLRDARARRTYAAA
ncbi:MAG: helix-turn-helix domain-containing protein [bacterium]|jgi:transcriptional regulator with XRE-family HTH domain|nr:helix-turn-helix domain-containing protein [Betaproteobacteria bacterium]